MSVRRAYCSAVDRNVPVRLKPGAAPRDRLTLQDPADLVCLDYKVRCTGWCCPLFSVADDPEPVLAGETASEEPAATRPPLNPRAELWTPPT